MLDSPPMTGRRVHLETFGCQMNELDSELVRSQLSALGYIFTDDRTLADVVIYNTCSVREQAENKVWSRLGINNIEKQEGRDVIVGVIGCMAEREGPGLMKRFPQVDLMCGPGELDKLPLLIDNASMNADEGIRTALQGSTTRRSQTLSAAADRLELLDLSRAFDPDQAGFAGRSAYVRITRGCNKFCTYCVVPHTRGPEIHRPPDHIVEECKRLEQQGVLEITLLGQTVNHYLYVHGTALTVDGTPAPQVGPGLSGFRPGPDGRPRAAGGAQATTFADLLVMIHEACPGVQRIRFVTSYPRDFGDDILYAIAEHPRLCRYLHAPAQSGSDAVLARMNRGYDRETFLDFAARARKIIPDVVLAGDIIVGFCGESEPDYEATRTLLQEVRFKNNFIFKYSPRPGTSAFGRLEDDVPELEKRRRNNDLLALQAEIGSKVHAEWVGREVPVFLEKRTGKGRKATSGARNGGVELRIQGESPSTGVQLSGRTPGDMICFVDVPEHAVEAHLGTIRPVRVSRSGSLHLEGDLVPEGNFIDMK